MAGQAGDLPVAGHHMAADEEEYKQIIIALQRTSASIYRQYSPVHVAPHFPDARWAHIGIMSLWCANPRWLVVSAPFSPLAAKLNGIIF